MSTNVIYVRSGAFDQKAAYQRNLMVSWLITYGGILIVMIGLKIAALFSEPLVIIPVGEKSPIEIIIDTTPITIVKENLPSSPGARHSQQDIPSIPVPRPDEEFVDEDTPLPTRAEMQTYGMGDSAGESDSYTENHGVVGGEFWPKPDVFQYVEKLPAFVFRAPLEYPRLARQAGLEGTVWVRALVDESGKVLKAILHRSSEITSLDDAAVAMAYNNRFSPGVQNGKAVKVWVSYSVVFSLSK